MIIAGRNSYSVSYSAAFVDFQTKKPQRFLHFEYKHLQSDI